MPPLPALRRADVIAAFRASGWRERKSVGEECVMAKADDSTSAGLLIPADDPIGGEILSALVEKAGIDEERYIDAALAVFEEKVVPKQDEKGVWTLNLTAPEEILDLIRYYHHAGDLIYWMPYAIENRWAFEAIGATEYLKVFDDLMPFYEAEQRIASDDERRAFTGRPCPERDRIIEDFYSTPKMRLNRRLLEYAAKIAEWM
jgi:hypothetical protein